MRYLAERYDLTKVPMSGASGGALAAVLAACGVDADKVLEKAYSMSVEHRIWDRPLGLLGIWGSLIEQWLDELLPDNAHELCRNRISVVVTSIPDWTQLGITDFVDKKDLINACMASSHIPWFLDFKLARPCRGRLCVDGSFPDFFTGLNSELLRTPHGPEGVPAIVFDYFDDRMLPRKGRMDMLEVKSYDEIRAMYKLGYDYAAKLHADGRFDRYELAQVLLDGKDGGMQEVLVPEHSRTPTATPARHVPSPSPEPSSTTHLDLNPPLASELAAHITSQTAHKHQQQPRPAAATTTTTPPLSPGAAEAQTGHAAADSSNSGSSSMQGCSGMAEGTASPVTGQATDAGDTHGLWDKLLAATAAATASAATVAAAVAGRPKSGSSSSSSSTGADNAHAAAASSSAMPELTPAAVSDASSSQSSSSSTGSAAPSTAGDGSGDGGGDRRKHRAGVGRAQRGVVLDLRQPVGEMAELLSSSTASAAGASSLSSGDSVADVQASSRGMLPGPGHEQASSAEQQEVQQQRQQQQLSSRQGPHRDASPSDTPGSSWWRRVAALVPGGSRQH